MCVCVCVCVCPKLRGPVSAFICLDGDGVSAREESSEDLRSRGPDLSDDKGDPDSTPAC